MQYSNNYLAFIFLGFLYSTILPAQPEEKLFKEARSHIDNGNINKAVNLYSKLVTKDPANIDYLTNRAYCYYKLKQYKICIKDCSKAIQLKPALGDKYYLYKLRSVAYAESENWDEAMKDCEEYLSLFFDDQEMLYQKGVIYYKQRKFDDAIKQFNHVLKLSDLSKEYQVQTLTRLGFCYLSMDSIEIAKVYCKKGFEADSMGLDPRNLLGAIHYEIGLYSETIKIYQQTLDVDSNETYAFLGIGQSFYSSQMYDSAFYYLKIYQKKDGSNYEVYKILADIELQKRNYSMALNYYKLYLNKASSSPAYNHVAWEMMLHGYYTKGLEFANKSVQLDKSNVDAYDTRGTIYYKLKMYSIATHDFNEALFMNPDYKNSYYFRGLSYRNLKQSEKACSDWMKLKAYENYDLLPGEEPIDTLLNKYCKRN